MPVDGPDDAMMHDTSRYWPQPHHDFKAPTANLKHIDDLFAKLLQASIKKSLSALPDPPLPCCLQISVENDEQGHLEVTWQNDQHRATLKADLTGMSFEILATKGQEEQLKTIKYQLGADIDCSESQECSLDESRFADVKWEQQEVCLPVL